MSYIHEIPYDQSTGVLRELYDADLKSDGYVGHSTSIFSLRPDVLDAFIKTVRQLRTHMRLRNYELVTVAAARAIGCKYWMLAHGAVLRKNGVSVEQLKAIIKDYHKAGLTQAEVDMLDLATRLSAQPGSTTPAEIQRLRDDGFSDEDITDIAIAAGVRNFYARIFDTLGAGPDPQLIEQEPELWEVIKDL